MSQQQTTKDILQPIFPIPIIAAPEPLAPFMTKVQQSSPNNQLQVYKRQYNRLVRENQLLVYQLAKVTEEKEALQKKYNCMPVGHPTPEERRKRVRRSADEIVRQFNCYIDKCEKSYGTEASLAQHIKIKHPDAYSTKQYEEHIGNLRKKMGIKTNLIIETHQDHEGLSKENNNPSQQ